MSIKVANLINRNMGTGPRATPFAGPALPTLTTR